MSQSDHDKEFRGVLNVLLYIGFTIIAMHLYFFCYDTLMQAGYTHPQLDRLIRRLQASTVLMNSPAIVKSAALVLLLIYTLGNKAKKSVGATWQQVCRYALAGLLLF